MFLKIKEPYTTNTIQRTSLKDDKEGYMYINICCGILIDRSEISPTKLTFDAGICKKQPSHWTANALIKNKQANSRDK